MKKTVKIIAIALAAIFVLSVAKDVVIKISVEKGVEFATGLKLTMGSIRTSILSARADIRDMKLYNPPGFEDAVMADVPEILIDYSVSSILNGSARLSRLLINLKEFTVVKNEKGELNLDSLKVVQAQKGGKKPGPKTRGKTPKFRIDVLDLKIGKAVYRDYSKPGAPSVREFVLNLDERYTDIDNPYAVVSLIVVKALANTTIANMAKFDVQALKGPIAGTLAGAQNVTSQAVKAAQDTAKKTQDAAMSLAGSFKNPFGP